MDQDPIRLLIVDDERSLREPLKKYLQQNYQFLVDTAATVSEAKVRVQQTTQPYDVVLIDEVLMLDEHSEGAPQYSGVDLMLFIKEQIPTIECIIYTGWGLDQVQKALRAGAYRYLKKPTSPDELAITIQLAADHSRLKQELHITQQEKEWLQTFLKVGRATTSVLNLDEVLDEVYQQVVALLNVSEMEVVLYDRSSATLTYELHMLNEQRLPRRQRSFNGDQYLTDWIISVGQPAVVQEYPCDLLPRPLNTEFYDIDQIKSWLGVPLIARNKTIGAMIVSSPQPNQFQEAERFLLTAIAGQVSVAIQNARLFRALHGERERLNALTRSSFDAIIAIDTDNIITVFNQQAEVMLGWSSSEMLGKKVHELHDDLDVARQLHAELYQNGEINNHKLTLKHKDSSCIPTYLSAVLLKDEQGNPIGQAGFMRDLRQLNLLKDRQQALMEVSQIVTGSLALEEVLKQIIQTAVTAFPTAESGSIHLYDATIDRLRITATTFDFSPEALEALNMKPGEGLAGWVFQQKQAIVADDVRQEPRYKMIEHPEIDVHASMICVPLKVKERAIGALCLSHGKQVGVFQAEDLSLLTSFADQAAIAIDNAQLYEEQERRNQLLMALNEASHHIRGQKETGKLLQEIVRLSVELSHCTAGALFINRPHLGVVELEVEYNLPLEPMMQIRHGQGLVGTVAESGQIEIVTQYENWSGHETKLENFNFKTAIALPIHQADKLEAILFIADELGLCQLNQTDRNILEKFAAQAAIAWQTSRLLGQEQRMFGQLTILHAISDYIQAARELDKILHVVSTGITASFGLCFNRVAMFLLDDKRECLQGRMGIGHLDQEQARADWDYDQEHGLNNFKVYLSRLEKESLPPMPIGENVQKLHLPIASANHDLFSQVVIDGQPRIATQIDLEQLPAQFLTAFEPDLPLAIVPLLAREQVIGLLVADNKFTRSPITLDDIEALMTFANTAALAIDNAQLLRQIKIESDRLRSFYIGSNALISAREPEQVLRDVTENARKAANASWVSLVLVEDGHAKSLVVTNANMPNDLSDIFREGGLSMQVIQSGQPAIIEDSSKERERVNPNVFDNGVAAAVCLPLMLQEKAIGVMWVHYDQPRSFTKSEVEILQLYVNQAALAFDSARRMQMLEQMRRTAQIVAQVTTLGNLGETLDSVVMGTVDAIGCDVVSLYVYDQEKDWIDYPPTMFGVRFPEAVQRSGGVERDSIVFQMLGRDTPYIVEDTVTDPYFREARFTNDEKVKSCVAIPLLVENEKVGIMFVNFCQLHLFTEDELQIIDLFAHQAAVAIRNAQLYRRVEVRAIRLNTLYEAGQALSGTLNLNTIFERLVEHAPLVTKPGQPVNLACLRMIEGNTSRVVAVYPSEKWESIRKNGGNIVNLTEGENHRIGIMGRAAVSRQSEIVGNVKAHPDFRLCDPTTHSEMAVPILLEDRVFAVINVEHEDENAFDQEDLQALELLAAQAAVAIQNARHAELLGIAAQVAREATALLEIDELLNATVRLISERFGFYHVGALLLDNVGGYAELKAFYPQTGRREITLGHKVRGGEGIVGLVIQTGKHYLAPSVCADPHFIANPDLPNTQAEMVIPLIARGKNIGVLDLQSNQPIELSRNDITTIQTMADQLANAIHSVFRFVISGTDQGLKVREGFPR